VEDKKNTDVICEEILREDISKLFGSSVLLYEIKGPFFFGASEKIFNTTSDFKSKPKFIIINMKEVPAIYLTGLHSLERLNLLCIKNNAKLMIYKLQARTYRAIEKYGFIKTLGEYNIYKNVEAAIIKISKYIN